MPFEVYKDEAETAAEEVLALFEEEESESGNNYVFADTMKEHAWTGPIVFEGVVTGDNRVFNANSINWQEETLPWPLRWQRASGQGHAGSVPVGRVDKLERKEDGSIHGYGVIIPELNDEAAEYLRILEAGVGGGCSVDGDSAQFEILEQEKGQPRVEFSSMRLRALSCVDIPAFDGARIHLIGPEPTELADEATEEPLETIDLDELATKKPFPFEKKEDGAKDEEDSEDKDEEDKDEKSPQDNFKAMIAAKKAKGAKKKVEASYGWNIDEALVASAIPTLPSTTSFLDPEFAGPTALTVTPDGRVFGHLALFNTCHIGFPGTCIKPPKGSKYQYFHTGQIETAEGDLVEVGRLTFKTGHADMSASPRIAAEHYDNTGAVAADVRAGEDKFGIWVVGALRPHLTDEDIRAFRCAPLSGDWRRIAGKLELVGALGVNTPGFPVPRVRALVASGETETLFTFLEEDDEEFVISDDELNLRLDKKLDLATKVDQFAGKDPSAKAPEGLIEDDVLDALSKKEIEAEVKNYTKSRLFADLKDLRELLDDSDEKMSAKVRKGLEEIYKVAIKVDDSGKKFSYDGFDLDIIENSGLDYDEWEAQLTLSGLNIEEFYNQCHDGDGRFCEGQDGPGRARDNVKGQHFVPGRPHGKDDPGHKPGGSGGSGGGSGGSGGGSGGSGGSGDGGGVNPKLYENYLTTRKRARGWAAAATIAAAALVSPIAPILQGLATAGGIAILGNPAVLSLIFVTGVSYAAKNTITSRKHRADYNRQVSKKQSRDRLGERRRREDERLRVST